MLIQWIVIVFILGREISRRHFPAPIFLANAYSRCSQIEFSSRASNDTSFALPPIAVTETSVASSFVGPLPNQFG